VVSVVSCIQPQVAGCCNQNGVNVSVQATILIIPQLSAEGANSTFLPSESLYRSVETGLCKVFPFPCPAATKVKRMLFKTVVGYQLWFACDAGFPGLCFLLHSLMFLTLESVAVSAGPQATFPPQSSGKGDHHQSRMKNADLWSESIGQSLYF